MAGFSSTATLLALLTAPLLAQTPFEQVLPESTVMAVFVDDVSSLREQAQGSAWAQVLADPAMASLDEALHGALDDARVRAVESWGLDPAELFGQLNGQLAFGLLSLHENERAFAPPEFAATLLLELDQPTDAFMEGFDALISRWADDSGLLFESETVRELPATLVASADGRRGAMHYLLVGSVLVVVFNSETVDGVEYAGALVDALAGQGADSLAGAPAFAASLASSGASPEQGLRCYMTSAVMPDLGPLLVSDDLASSAADSKREPRFEGWEFDALRSVSGSAWFDDGWVYSQARFDVTRAKGLFSVVAAAVDQQRCDLLKLAPPDVVSAFAADLDLSGAFDAGLELMARVDVEQTLEFIKGMSSWERSHGLHLKDDIIDGLDGQLLLYTSEVAPEQALELFGEVPLNSVIVAGLRDGAATRDLLEIVVRKLGLHAARTRIEFEGQELFSIALGPGLAVAYAVLDDLVVVSPSQSLVEQVLHRAAHPELPSLVDSEVFRMARERLPGGESVLSYARGGDGIRAVLRAVDELKRTGSVSILPFGPPELLSQPLVDIMRGLSLPERDVVAEHVEGAELAVLVLLPETGGAVIHKLAP